MPLTDTEDLAARAAAGDMEALGTLYDRWTDVVWRVCYLRVRNPAIADDAAQDTWVAVAQSVQRYRPRGGGWPAWLLTIAARSAMAHGRRAHHRREIPTADLMVVDRPAAGETPEDTAVRAESGRRVVAAIRRLPRAQQQCLYLRYWQGLTFHEIGQLMGRSEGAAKLLHCRACKTLGRLFPGVRLPARSAVSVTGQRAW